MILFFDIDGTLLEFDGRMPYSAREALRCAKEKGHKLILCSGRSKCAVVQLQQKFGFDGIVCSAGAYVEYREQVVSSKVLTKREKKKLLGFLEDSHAVYGLQTRGNIVCPTEMQEAYESTFQKKEEAGEEERSDMSADAEEQFDDLGNTFVFVEDIRSTENIEKAFYYGSAVGLREAERLLAPEFEVRSASYNMPDPNNGEISLTGITKSYGMQKLLDFLGETRENTIAFGDGHNDLEMLEFAGIGVAMGNAVRELKERADYITDVVNEDGIRKAMLHLGLI